MPKVSRASIAVAILCAGALLPSSGAASENDAAWRLLLENQPGEARAAFEKNARSADRRVSGEAHRGLSLVARFTGASIEASRQSYEAFRRDGDTLIFAGGKLGRTDFSSTWDGHALSAGYEVHAALDRKPTPMTAALSAELSTRYANDGDLAKAAALDNRLGVVREWWAIGPFSNVSGSGFDKAYPPETGVDLGRSYEGRNGNKVSWFPLRVPSPSNWLFSQNHLPYENAILYFAAQIESPGERKVLLSFGASGSFKVFLNDRLLFAERVFRNTGEDTFVREVTLRKGANRILVKLGNENQYSNFQVRFADSSGRGAVGLKSVKPEGVYPADSGAEADLRRSPRVDAIANAFRARLRADSTDEEAALLLMDLYCFAELTDSAEALGLRQLARWPNSSWWLQSLSEAMLRSRQPTRSQEYMKAAQRASAENHAGWAYESNRLAQSAGPEAVLEFLRTGPQRFQDSPQGLIAKMVQLARLGRNAEALNVFAELERRKEYDFTAASVLAAVYKAQGKKAEAEKAWTRLLAYEHTNVSAWLSLADVQLGAGDFTGAAGSLVEGERYAPSNPNLPLKLADMYLQNKRYAEAEKALAAAEALAPTHSAVLGVKANLLALMGRKDEAHKALLRNVEYNYNDFASWDKLRELDGEPSFESLAPLPPVDSLLRAAAGWEGLKREKGALVAFIEDLFFYPNRAARHRFFRVLHVPTQEAVNNSTQFDIPYNGSFQTLQVARALTRKKAGNEVDAEVRGSTIVFKSLEPGDAIVVEWTLKDDYEGAMARQAWGRFAFRRAVSVFDARLRLYMAGTDTVGYTLRGEGIRQENSERGGVKARIFRRAPLLLPPDEKNVPETDVTSPDVLYSTFSDWGQIADWYADLTENKSAASPNLRRLADSLFRGAATDAEKIARVQQFVSSAIAYSSLSFRQSGWIPQAAQEVLASRLGDCKDKAALAKSLLELAGIPSHLVLVATRNEFGTRPGPVGPHFNHCLLAYTLDGKERFMELTDTELYWSRLSKYDQGAVALVARKGNRSLIRLPRETPDQSVTRRVLRFTLGENGDVAIASETVRRGLAADGTRGGYRHLSPDERSAEMRKAVSGDYSDVALDTAWFGDMNPAVDSVLYGYRYHARQAVKAQGKTRIFSLYVTDKLTADDVPASVETQDGLDLYPDWYSVGTYDQTGTVVFPAGWKLLELPAPVRLKTPYGEYSLVFQVQGNKLTYVRKAVFRLGENVPAADAGAVRGFLAAVAQSDDVQLLFLKR